MGSWGSEIFSNDSALDWVGNLVRANDPAMIVDTLAIALGHDPARPLYMHDDDVLAAAEIVAALYGAPLDDLPDEAMDWLEDGGADLDPDVIDLALEAVDRVVALWTESDDEDDFDDSRREVIRDLEARLHIAREAPRRREYRPAGIQLTPEHLEVMGSPEQPAWDQGLLAVPPRRIIRFPPDRSFGTLWRRPWESPKNRRWHRLAQARGIVLVPAASEVHLVVGDKEPVDMAPLAALGPNDLQSLYLYGEEITDESLVHVRGLTGLKSIDMSNDTSVGDAGLHHLYGLLDLEEVRLTLGRASDYGLAALKRALPNCRIYRW